MPTALGDSGTATAANVIAQCADGTQLGTYLGVESPDATGVDVTVDVVNARAEEDEQCPADEQFYPDGVKGWMVKLDAKPEGGISFDERFFVDWPASHRPHQVRLEGGDCSSDSYCYP